MEFHSCPIFKIEFLTEPDETSAYVASDIEGWLEIVENGVVTSKLFVTFVELAQSLSLWRESGNSIDNFVCHPDWAGESPLLYARSSTSKEFLVFSGEQVVLSVGKGEMKAILEKLLEQIKIALYIKYGQFRIYG